MSASATRPGAGFAGRAPGPVAWLALGITAVTVIAALTATAITAIVLDETIYKYAASQYVGNLPGELVHDRTSRGIARLYSLVLTPVLWVFDGATAVRAGRALNALLWSLTAVPVFLLARRVLASRGLAVAAGVLSIAVPWLTLSTILFSESLAYLLLAVTVLIMARALEQPSLLRHAIVAAGLVALILTRVQFVALVPAWALFLAWPRRGQLRRLRDARVLSSAAVAVGVLVVFQQAGVLNEVTRRLAGPYSTLRDRTTFQGDFGLAALFEVEMLALGTGVVPAILAVAWVRRARAAGDDASLERRLATLGLTLLGALFAATLFAQGGYLENASEERYFIYAVPLIWIGALAASERGLATRGELVRGGLVLALVCALVPLRPLPHSELAFLAPVTDVAGWAGPEAGRIAADVTGWTGILSARDLLALVTLAVALGSAAVAARRGRTRLVLVPAVVLQLVVGGLALAALHGTLRGVPGVTGGQDFAALAWVDRAADGDVSLLVNPRGRDDNANLEQVFWNGRVRDTVRPGRVAPGSASPLYPLTTFPARVIGVRPDLTIAGAPVHRSILQSLTAPHLQVDGRVLGRSTDDAFELRRLDAPGRASWAMLDLDPDGHVARPVQLLAAPGAKVTMDIFAPSAGQVTSVELRLGRTRQTVTFDAATPGRTLTLDLCGRRGPQRGRITPVSVGAVPDQPGRTSAALVTAVRRDPCR